MSSASNRSRSASSAGRRRFGRQLRAQLFAGASQFLAEALNVYQRRTQIVRRDVHNRFQFLVFFRERLRQRCESFLGAFALGDVADETGEQPPVRQPHFADGKIDRKRRPVFPPRHHLPADADDPGLAGAAIIGEIPVVLLPVRRRHQDIDVFSDDLSGLVSESLLGGAIHRFNQATLIDGDNALDGGLENGAQSFLAVRQRRLREVRLSARDFGGGGAGAARFELVEPRDQIGLRHS